MIICEFLQITVLSILSLKWVNFWSIFDIRLYSSNLLKYSWTNILFYDILFVVDVMSLLIYEN